MKVELSKKESYSKEGQIVEIVISTKSGGSVGKLGIVILMLHELVDEVESRD